MPYSFKLNSVSSFIATLTSSLFEIFGTIIIFCYDFNLFIIEDLSSSLYFKIEIKI